MKKTSTILAFLMALLAITSCHKDKEFGSEKPEVGEVVVSPALNHADFAWKVVYPGKFQTGVEISDNEALKNSRIVEGTKDGELFKANISQLEASTKYYYRIVVWNKMSRHEDKVKSFTTLTPDPEPDVYTITVSANPEEGGTVTGGGEYVADSTCVVTATANAGYTFVNWTENGSQVSSNAEYTFTVNDNRSLVANFSSEDYIISVVIEPENGGSVTGAGGYNYGDECTLTATPNDGYDFTNWTKNGEEVSTNTTYSFTVTESAEYVAHFQVQSYTITVAANPENGGTVEGGGTYEYGQTCIVKATEANGYTFLNWTENNGQVSSNVEYAFTVTGDRDLLANFTAEGYIISVEIEPENGGTVTGAGGYNYGDECTLTATPNEGYNFTKWTQNGTQISTEQSITFTVTETASYKAHFTAKSYTISVSAEPSNGGTVEGGGTYQYGQTCTVKATEANGYHFVNWTENSGQVSSNAEYTFTVNGNRSLVANFSAEDYIISVEIEPENGGTVTGAGGYNYGDECTLTSTPNEGYDFTKWTKNGTQISTEQSISFTVTESASYKAHFSAKSYTISVSAEPSNGGNVTGGGNYHYGEECTLTATANTGYRFDHWTKNGSQISGGASITVTVTADATYVAHFNAQSYTITTQSNPSNGGTVTGGGQYTYGQNCTLVATANTGYTFDHWTKDGSTISGGATINVTVTANATYVAYFNTQSYTITTQSNPTNGGTVTGGGQYTYGQNCTLTAIANTGYTFDHWTKDGSTISGGATISFSVTANATYVAYFNTQSYTITTQSNPTNGGTVSGGGNYTYGQNCTLTATANTGYTFDHWTKNGSTISGGATISFSVTASATYVAHFNAQSQVPTGAINGLFTINGNGDQVYFSRGNLQYNKTTHVWSFMEHQYDMVETLNQNVGENYANQNIISLFGWGTSGWNSGAVCYQPWSTSTDNSDYYPGGSYTNNLTGAYANADWGVYNSIINGGNQPGQWRTLTGGNNGEWKYIFDTRTASTVNGVANARYAKAKVNNVQGVILFPDSYTHPNGVAQPVGINETGDAGWNGNNYSAADFEMMEQNGCVFLPGAGYRYGTSVRIVGSGGHYWSTSANGSNYAYSVRFRSGDLSPSYYYYRSYGFSVRLVAPAE